MAATRPFELLDKDEAAYLVLDAYEALLDALPDELAGDVEDKIQFACIILETVADMVDSRALDLRYDGRSPSLRLHDPLDDED